LLKEIFFSGCFFFAIKKNGRRVKKTKTNIDRFFKPKLSYGEANLTRGGLALSLKSQIWYVLSCHDLLTKKALLLLLLL